MNETLERNAPKALAVLRIVTALLFMQHGMQKLFGWPPGGHHGGGVALFSFIGLAGVLEFFGGALVAIGFQTRIMSFLLSGQMAIAYWAFHFRFGVAKPGGWMPVVNEGESAILFCFVFLYLVFAGAGAWSIDTASRWRANLR